MQNKMLWILLLVFFGCADDLDNAGVNLKKGDSFAAKGEYEIAEYYYEKVPEESPYYKRAQRKLADLQKKKEEAVIEGYANESAKEEVSIVRHSYQMNNFGRVPFHNVTFANNTDRGTSIIEMEFIYYDESGREITRLATMVSVSIPPKGQQEVQKISPGMVNEKFNRVGIHIQRVLYN